MSAKNLKERKPFALIKYCSILGPESSYGGFIGFL